MIVPIRTAKAANATFAYQPKPSREFLATARDRLRVASGVAQVFVRVPNPVPAGEVAVSAFLEVTAEAEWAGSRTLTVQRAAAPGRPYRDINWDNKPGTFAGSSPVAVTQAGTTRLWRFDVTADVASGSRMLDFRITSSEATTRWLKGLRSNKGFPRLVVTTEAAPEAPVDVLPDGVIGVGAPVLQWQAQEDVDTVRGEVGALDVNGDWATTSWASAEIASADGRLDLAAAGYLGVANGATVYARVAQRVPRGWSDWSEPVQLARVDKPVLTISSPGATTEDPTPPIVWTPPVSQAAWQVWVQYLDQKNQPTVSSGKRAGAASSWTPRDRGGKAGDRMLVTLHVWDDQDRSPSETDPAHVEATVATVFQPTATVSPVSSVVTSQVGEGPGVRVSWTRAAGVSDEVIIDRDGEFVARVPGADAAHVDYTAAPNTLHTYTVRAVVNGSAADQVGTSQIQTVVTGVWLLDADTGRHISLSGLDLRYEYGVSTAHYTPLNAAAAIRRTTAVRGAEGAFVGALDPRDDRTADDLMDDLWWMRSHPERTLRLIVGDLNIPVVATNPHPVVDVERTRTSGVRQRVSFSFEQVGELPFEAI